jgi:hypothetical protein
VESFRITANGVADETQIHTHMCYSEFNDIIASIADMDADVITIETSRSDMELLDAFDTSSTPTRSAPASTTSTRPTSPPSTSSADAKAAERIPAERLWVNPDCGLKTRQWAEVIPALQHMVAAARSLRADPRLPHRRRKQRCWCDGGRQLASRRAMQDSVVSPLTGPPLRRHRRHADRGSTGRRTFGNRLAA